MWVWSLGGEDPLEKSMATHSSILAWRTPWTEQPGGLLSIGWQRVRHDWKKFIHHNDRMHNMTGFGKYQCLMNKWGETAAAKSLQSCLNLCDPIDGSPPGSLGFSRQEHWSQLPFTSPINACKWKVKVKSLSHVRLFATPWTAAHQSPPSMGFSRQEYWSGLPLPSPRWG